MLAPEETRRVWEVGTAHLLRVERLESATLGSWPAPTLLGRRDNLRSREASRTPDA